MLHIWAMQDEMGASGTGYPMAIWHCRFHFAFVHSKLGLYSLYPQSLLSNTTPLNVPFPHLRQTFQARVDYMNPVTFPRYRSVASKIHTYST